MIVNRSMIMIKTISYTDKNYLNNKIEDLKQLTKCKYNRILIPNFSYNVFENVLTIHMDYIKGQQINSHTKNNYTNIVYEDLVCSTNLISARGYAFENFIITKNKIYYIDLDDIGFSSIEERKIKFDKDWVNRK